MITSPICKEMGESAVEMLTAKILPDEFIRGYRGRLKVLNVLFPTVMKFMAALREQVHSRELFLPECPAAVTLAIAAGIPLQDLVRKHSLLPFHRTVPNKDFEVNHGDPARLDLIALFGTRVWRQTDAWFCVDCM